MYLLQALRGEHVPTLALGHGVPLQPADDVLRYEETEPGRLRVRSAHPRRHVLGRSACDLTLGGPRHRVADSASRLSLVRWSAFPMPCVRLRAIGRFSAPASVRWIAQSIDLPRDRAPWVSARAGPRLQRPGRRHGAGGCLTRRVQMSLWQDEFRCARLGFRLKNERLVWRFGGRRVCARQRRTR